MLWNKDDSDAFDRKRLNLQNVIKSHYFCINIILATLKFIKNVSTV